MCARLSLQYLTIYLSAYFSELFMYYRFIDYAPLCFTYIMCIHIHMFL